MQGRERSARPAVGLVLPGGGVRGAYEAGALSVLLPALEARGDRVEIVCGTSVGAINAAVVASTAHLSATDQAAALVDRWSSLRKGDVIERLVGPRSVVRLAQFAGEVLELPFLRVSGLMDPRPLRGSLERWIDWAALHGNVRSGLVRSACVVATSLERGQPVAFLESAEAPPPGGKAVRYLRVQLAGEHVRASAAIPVLFPPVEVTTPVAAAGHYIDGGTRLNAPIAPALALGAGRIAVIGFEPLGRARPAAPDAGLPRLADVAANVLDGLLIDQVADDVHRMLTINSFFVEDHAGGPSPAARAYRAAQGKDPYRRVSFALIAPERQGELGALAEEVFNRRYGGLRGLRSLDFLLLARLLGGGRARSRGELLSFLLFDQEFVEALIDAGRNDARRWLDAIPGVWCSDPALAGLDAPAAAGVADHVALDEYRAMRRR